jgi:hypothetical protein
MRATATVTAFGSLGKLSHGSYNICAGVTPIVSIIP